MRTDVLERLRRVEQMRCSVQEVDERLARLDPVGRLMLDILLDDDREKVLRIANEIGVSKATGYRYVEALLEEISNILPPIG